MKQEKRHAQVVGAGLALGCVGLVASAGASVINLDFGPTATNRPTNDPYHALTQDAANQTWNTCGTSDIANGSVKFGNNTTATGVAINIGITTSTNATSKLSVQPDNPVNAGAADWFSTGIYTPDSPALDFICVNSADGSNKNRGITMQISGLAAGKYDIYYVGRNTKNNNGSIVGGVPDRLYTQTIYAGQSASAGDFTFTGAGYSSAMIDYTVNNLQTSNWVAGGTYVKLTIDLATGNKLNLGFVGGNTELRGMLNSLQIVSVPEPLGVSVLAMGSALLSMRRRRA